MNNLKNGGNQSPVGILGTGSALPERVLTNEELETMVDTSDEWITSRTGIKERRVAAPEQASSDLAYEAAIKALDSAGLSAADLDLIMVATVTPDMAFPATACIVQNKLGATHAATFDLSAGCSGFVYALEVGAQMVRGGYKHVLVIGVDLLSRITDYSDRSTCVLFGDGAGAAILGPVSEGYGIIATELGADGGGGEYLTMPGGGSRNPATLVTVNDRQHYIRMSGNEVFKFAVRIMNSSTERVLQAAGLSAQQVDWFIPHQANIRIIQAAADRLELTPEKVFVNVDRYGNTSAASIAIALDEVVRTKDVKDGDYLLLVGFGAGLTWGSTVIRWQGSKNRE